MQNKNKRVPLLWLEYPWQSREGKLDYVSKVFAWCTTYSWDLEGSHCLSHLQFVSKISWHMWTSSANHVFHDSCKSVHMYVRWGESVFDVRIKGSLDWLMSLTYGMSFLEDKGPEKSFKSSGICFSFWEMKNCNDFGSIWSSFVHEYVYIYKRKFEQKIIVQETKTCCVLLVREGLNNTAWWPSFGGSIPIHQYKKPWGIWQDPCIPHACSFGAERTELLLLGNQN